jgi:hypothetical protein
LHDFPLLLRQEEIPANVYDLPAVWHDRLLSLKCSQLRTNPIKPVAGGSSPNHDPVVADPMIGVLGVKEYGSFWIMPPADFSELLHPHS